LVLVGVVFGEEQVVVVALECGVLFAGLAGGVFRSRCWRMAVSSTRVASKSAVPPVSVRI
jgi:hypothetical protein